MPPRQWELRIADILEAIEDIGAFIVDLDFESFRRDRKTTHAVIRDLTVIGEASSHVPDDLAAQYPEIPWADMRAMRNVVVHEYFGTDARIIWDTARDDLPGLVEPLTRILLRSNRE